jgi:hypothetical protein
MPTGQESRQEQWWQKALFRESLAASSGTPQTPSPPAARSTRGGAAPRAVPEADTPLCVLPLGAGPRSARVPATSLFPASLPGPQDARCGPEPPFRSLPRPGPREPPPPGSLPLRPGGARLCLLCLPSRKESWGRGPGCVGVSCVPSPQPEHSGSDGGGELFPRRQGGAAGPARAPRAPWWPRRALSELRGWRLGRCWL